jgi:hypothetical protein
MRKGFTVDSEKCICKHVGINAMLCEHVDTCPCKNHVALKDQEAKAKENAERLLAQRY